MSHCSSAMLTTTNLAHRQKAGRDVNGVAAADISLHATEISSLTSICRAVFLFAAGCGKHPTAHVLPHSLMSVCSVATAARGAITEPSGTCFFTS
ncbi:hypothetical protein CEXT_513501 [Caerostris extrusa]|uniref:Uncharacterized protein n=1 Tax=Caerostris extrusa TaxID=172846 RepID=A0AAV4U6L9_CAEEX|nr:hypothetical protein CEXT_513501 [Caerostris extrusa]